jgi:hypothetical protein
MIQLMHIRSSLQIFNARRKKKTMMVMMMMMMMAMKKEANNKSQVGYIGSITITKVNVGCNLNSGMTIGIKQ